MRMEARLTEIDRAALLHYLSFRGGEPGEEQNALLERCAALLMETARPRAVWKLFDYGPDGTLVGSVYRPGGEDIRLLLADCSQVILMAATLGAEAEALLRRAQRRDMGEALILDAAGSAAIENVCDNLCADLAAHFAPRHLTERFSPGYGDMPLSDQEPFFRALDVSRRIGLSLTERCLMIPQKSVTALLGVSDRPQPRRGSGCAACPRAADCAFKKEGKRCGLF